MYIWSDNLSLLSLTNFITGESLAAAQVALGGRQEPQARAPNPKGRRLEPKPPPIIAVAPGGSPNDHRSSHTACRRTWRRRGVYDPPRVRPGAPAQEERCLQSRI